MSRFILIIITCLTLTTLSACGGGTDVDNFLDEAMASTQVEELDQSKVDTAFLEIGDTASYIFFPLQLVMTCNLFDLFIKPVEYGVECGEEGRFSFSIDSASCEDEEGFYAEASMSLSLNGCTTDWFPIEGSAAIGLAMDESNIAISISDAEAEVYGILFSASDISVTLDENGTLGCQGELSIGRIGCQIAPDCSDCALEE